MKTSSTTDSVRSCYIPPHRVKLTHCPEDESPDQDMVCPAFVTITLPHSSSTSSLSSPVSH